MKRNTFASWGEIVPDVPPMTADELLRSPEYEHGYELVEGRLIRVPPASGGHGNLSAEINVVLRIYVKEHQLGYVLAAETGFVVSRPGDPETVLAPDTAFVRTDRAPARDSREWDTFWRLAPDLVVEVASPSQYAPEMAEKAQAWLAAGVRLVWVVWPSTRHIDVWLPGSEMPGQTLGMADTLDGRDVVPGFSHPVARLFT